MNYSEEEKEAINNLNFIVVTDIYDNEVNIDKTKIINKYNESVGVVLNLIQKQDKIIDKFSKALVNCVGTCPIDYNDDFENDCENCQDTLEKCWIEYFKKVVDEDVKD